MLEFFAINVKANFLSVKRGEKRKKEKKGKDHQSGSSRVAATDFEWGEFTEKRSC